MTPLNLSTRLTEALPTGIAVRAYHISTFPAKTDAIYSAASFQPEETTYCESHFLVITTPPGPDRGELAVLALEVLVFTTPALTTVFVSKADSTGYASLLNASQRNISPIKAVTQAFIGLLLEPRLTEARVALSLFARAQDQYLFPGSIDNVEKHVLDDRQLIKWWCRVSDSVWRPHSIDKSHQQISAHLVVPGLEKGETRAFFPPSNRTDPADSPKWSNNYPVDLLTVDSSLPPRCLIPRLPDDPKSRFLGDLDLDHVGEDGHWRTIKSLDQFWEFMSYRQECSAGRLVGFLWVMFVRPEEIARAAETGNLNADGVTSTAQPQLPTPGDSQHQSHGDVAPEIELEELGQRLGQHSPPPSSPVIAPVTDIPSTLPEPGAELVVDSNDNVETEQHPPSGRGVDVRWPEATRGQIVTDADTYEELIDVLLHLDFTGQPTAAASTSKWISSVLEKTEKQTFGLDVVGVQASTTSTRSISNGASSDAPVANVLTGIRKKRKPEQPISTPEAVAADPATNFLSAGLVRKKPKIVKD